MLHRVTQVTLSAVCSWKDRFHSNKACKSSSINLSSDNSTAMLHHNNFPFVMKYPLNPILHWMANTAEGSLKLFRFSNKLVRRVNRAQEYFTVGTLNHSPPHLTRCSHLPVCSLIFWFSKDMVSMNTFQRCGTRVPHAELLHNHFCRRQNFAWCTWSQAISEKQELTAFCNSVLKHQSSDIFLWQ